MSRPLIGITTYLAPASWGVWRDQPAALLPLRYVELVQRSGATAVLLPPDDAPSAAAETVARIDGLVVSGGPDVDPARYGQAHGPHTQSPAVERDAWESALVRAARAAGLPLLGICRGMQLLNVVLGGDLVQHLPDRVGHEDHSPEPGRYSHHPVVPVPGTALAAVLGEDKVDVPTYHHQAVDRIAPGLRASAHAFDGTVEAVEAEDGPFLLGVQWHPEQGSDLRLTKALVQAAGSGKDDLHDRRES
jgi:putative glutamine amidotransferase